MVESIRAVRAIIQVASRSIDGFMLPDGAYRMSQAQTAETVDRDPASTLRFLRSNSIKALLGDSYTDCAPESVEVEPEPGKRGQTRFNALSLEVVTAYWIHQCFQGNKQALGLVMGLALESLDRRFDAAFKVSRPESGYNDRLVQRLSQIERDLSRLGEGFALDDQIRQERDRFEKLLRENGIDPWKLEGE